MNKIDAYIIERKLIGGADKYKMDISYNEKDACFLHQDEKAHDFAIKYKEDLPQLVDDMIFTDEYGFLAEKEDEASVLGSIRGIDNIKESIEILSNTALMEKADLTVHLDEVEYPLVRNNKEYSDWNGLNTEIFHYLVGDLEALEANVLADIIKRRFM